MVREPLGRERSRCGERAVGERGMKRETKGERESENRGIEK